jgi:wyosine [tRNA(Phe)-imidazoG37] synthetase (radical SAM superfamily)
MLIYGMEYDSNKIAEFLRELKPDKAYISVPIRPSAEKWAKPAKEYDKRGLSDFFKICND